MASSRQFIFESLTVKVYDELYNNLPFDENNKQSMPPARRAL